jgi:hypothetical protein
MNGPQIGQDQLERPPEKRPTDLYFTAVMYRRMLFGIDLCHLVVPGMGLHGVHPGACILVSISVAQCTIPRVQSPEAVDS